MTDKQYSLTNQRAIENEESWLTRLEHPNVIRLRSILERQPSRQQIFRARSMMPGQPWFIVTDYLPGGDLNSVLAQRGKLSAVLALALAERIGDALSYLHRHNCIHCDIKPRNILFRQAPGLYALTPETQPIVIDFGIAKNPTEGPQLASGTPRWITPELSQAMQKGRKIEVDPSWDVYALALVLHSALTGRKPEPNSEDVIPWSPVIPADFRGDPTVKDPIALARGINALMTEATAPAPGSRIRAAAFTDRVRALQSHVKIPSSTQSTPPRVSTTPPVQPSHSQVAAQRNWWLPLGGIAAALLVVAGLLLWSQTTAPPPAVVTPDSVAESGDNGAAVPAETDNNAEGPEDDLPAVNVMGTPEPTPLQTPTATPTEQVIAATSTKLAVAASATPRKATPTPRPVTAPLEKPLAQSLLERGTPGSTSGGAPTKASAVASPTVTKLPTATRLPPTQTPVPATPPAVTAPPPTAAANAALTVELGAPADNAVASGPVRFTWTPSRALLANECFEVRFWPVGGSWRAGFGIWGANRNNFVERDFNGAFAADYRSLSRGLTYSWGVLLVECTTGAAQELVSSIRSIRYNPTP
jgi:serine/threonine protein kinase